MRQCFYIGWNKRNRRIWNITEEAKRHHPKESCSDETGRRSDPARETSRPALRTSATEVEATPRRVRDSSWERE